MANYTVSSGVTSSGLTLSAGDLMNVSGGGTTINIHDGGEEQLFADAVASTTTVTSGGVLITGGGTEIGTTVDNAGLEQIGGSGTDIDTVVSAGGVQWLYASAIASSTTLSGGTQVLGGVTSSIPFGIQPTSGGTAIGDVVDAGGHEYVGTGAKTSGTVVHSGGTQQVGGSTTWSYYYGLSAGTSVTMSTNLSGGVASDTVVSSGGVETVASGGTTISTSAYGEEQVVAGGVASATTVESGGVILTGSSTESGTVVMSGGLAQIGSASVDIDTVVSSGGVQWAYEGAAASGTTLSGGTQILGGVTSSIPFGLQTTTGGTAVGDVVDVGGGQFVGTGATASGTVVNSGGTQQVGGSTTWKYQYGQSAGVSVTMSTNLSGGVVSNTVVSSGGTEIVGSAGVATSTTVISSHVLSGSGGLVVDSGGSAVDAVASGGRATGISILVSSGGATTGTVVTAADETVYSGGVASGTTVSGGAQLYLNSGSSGAIASGFDTTVLSGGVEQVLDFAVETGGTIDAGGTIGVAGTMVGETVLLGGGATMLVDGNGAHGSSISGIDFGSVTISSGGAAIGDTVMSGGHEWIFGGGSASGITVSDGGTFVVSGTAGSAATASGTTVLAGGIETVFVSGTESGGTVSSGGEISVNGAMTGETILAGGNYFIGPLSGGLGLATSTTVFGTGHIEGGSTATADMIQSGGMDIVAAGGAATSTTVSSGGALQLLSGGTAIDTILLNGGSIDVAYVPFVAGATASLNSSTDVLTVTDGGNTLTYQMAGAYSGDTFHVSSDTTGDTLVTMTACFCTGTRILTDRGEIAVEHLAIGDRLATTAGTFRPVMWIGHRRMDFTRHPEPEVAQPILIRTNAIADGAPHRDLYVSPDHAVLLDDMLVPARLLVNGGSIRRESECRIVTYYHIELDTHDILLAENLAAESYLDTGNRGMFANGATALILHPDLTNDQDRRVAQSCRPFADDPALVEPIWHRLAARSATVGHPLPAAVETTRDPDLCVVINEKTVKPVNVRGGRYSFVLPSTRSPVHLVSNATKPNALRPWVEDHRQLGVMISRLTLKRGAEMAEIPLDHPQLTNGWWAAERDQASLWRWTNGDATVAMPRGGAAVLEVTVGETVDYPVTREPAVTSTTPVKAA